MMFPRYVISAFLLTGILLTSGCMTRLQQEYLTNHPELTEQEVKDLTYGYVRAGQPMEMVRAMFGDPYAQAAPGYSEDLMIFWTPDAQSSYQTKMATNEDEKAVDLAVAQAVKAATQIVQESRGDLRLVYFSRGRVTHQEIRENVFSGEATTALNQFRSMHRMV